MATLNPNILGINGIGSSSQILKQVNRFQIIFYDENKQQIAKDLSLHVTEFIGRPVCANAELIDENADWYIYEMNLGIPPFTANIITHDDMGNKAAIDLYELAATENFTISLQILDNSDTMIESFTLTEANVIEIEMNDLDASDFAVALKNITVTYENAVHSIKKQP